jgi:RHS repeat-associated protein
VNDADTGLVYMQQRYYEPVAGRFLSVDPVATEAGTGSSFNRYV